MESTEPKGARATQVKYAAAGKCERCGERKPRSKTLCRACLRTHNTATAESKARRMAEGKCIDCGAELATTRYCRACQDKQNARIVAWRARQGADA